MTARAASDLYGAPTMASGEWVDLLNEQIGHELGAHQQYLACATYYDGETLPRLAAFFYAQALEERDHALMMVRYLLDAGIRPTIPGVAAPHCDFADVVAPVALALEQERRVSAQINALAALARRTDDLTSEQFMQWFIKEQIEEIATMSDLLRVVERARENPLMAEEYLAREGGSGGGADPTAPSVAGA